MERVRCANPECRITWEEENGKLFAYCSVECAVYDGVFSVRTGWNEDALEKKKQGRSSVGRTLDSGSRSRRFNSFLPCQYKG